MPSVRAQHFQHFDIMEFNPPSGFVLHNPQGSCLTAICRKVVNFLYTCRCVTVNNATKSLNKKWN